VQESSLIKFPI